MKFATIFATRRETSMWVWSHNDVLHYLRLFLDNSGFNVSCKKAGKIWEVGFWRLRIKFGKSGLPLCCLKMDCWKMALLYQNGFIGLLTSGARHAFYGTPIPLETRLYSSSFSLFFQTHVILESSSLTFQLTTKVLDVCDIRLQWSTTPIHKL